MRAAVPILALLALLAASLPVVEAQVSSEGVLTSLGVRIYDEGKPAVPGRPTLVAVMVRYQWGLGGAAAEPTRIELSLEDAPSWAADPHIVPDVLFANWSVGFTSNVELNATLNFTAKADAPAFQTGNFTVVARAARNGNLAGSEGRGTLTTRPDFVGNVSVEADRAVVVGGDWQPVPFRLRNHGNGATQVALKVDLKPEPSEVRLPPAVTLPVNGSAVVEVLLRLPWTAGVDGLLTVTAEGKSVVNPLATPAVTTASTEIDGRTPVPLPAWLLLAGPAIAFLLRKPRNHR